MGIDVDSRPTLAGSLAASCRGAALRCRCGARPRDNGGGSRLSERGTRFATATDMKDIVVILHLEAIPAVQQICAGLPDYEVYLFDPVLGDSSAAAHLRNVQLFTQIGGPSYHSMDQGAHAAAFALEAELDVTQRAHSGISIAGWQHLNLSYLFITLRWYAALWELMGPRLRQRRVHVFINDNPAEYYFNSFVPSLSLVSYLQKHAIEYIAYDYGSKGATVYTVPDLPGKSREGGRDYLLTHLPTCIYDHDHFREEMRAAGKKLINLQAKYWDVPIEADKQIGLLDMQAVEARLAPALQKRLTAFTRSLSEALQRLLAPHIGLPAYCERQVSHLANLYRSQFVTRVELRRYFRDLAPAKFVLSEHDTCFHGPLISFAEQRALPVVLLPHSKIMGNLEFTYGNILALTHPMQGTSIHDGEDKPVRSQPIIYPEQFAGTSVVGRGLRTISLMLNSQSLNGVPFAPADTYLEGIKRIIDWCRARDVNFKIRCKPGYTIFGLLRAYVGVDPDALARNVNESMDEHVRDCDLSLMYDMPTSGSLYFLRNSLPILNPVVTVLTKHQSALVHPDLIVPESVDVTLDRLEGFRSDPLSLHTFRADQFRAYLSQFQDARPLRTYL